MTAPTVSIVIPCYDLGGYLDEAVESVLAQTYADFEIIVVDDGSSDPATQELLAGYRRPKTRVLRMPHTGLAAARNRGIAEARGRYICALDADDRLAPSFLARTVAVLESDPSLTFASAWLRMFGEERREWTPERCDLQTLLREDTVLTAALVRRDAVLAVGGYDCAMPVQGDEDWDLWLTLVERGHRGVIIPDVLFEYRRRAASMSTVCWFGPGHLPLARYRVAKHDTAYRRHLFDVFRDQDEQTAALLRDNDALERRLASELEPRLAARREELARLQATAATSESETRAVGANAATSRTADLEEALVAAEREVAALRASMSWRVTAPLRAAYGWWLHRRGTP